MVYLSNTVQSCNGTGLCCLMCLGTPTRHYTKLKQRTTLYCMLNNVAFFKIYIIMWLAHVGFMFNALPVIRSVFYAELYIYRNRSYTVYKN